VLTNRIHADVDLGEFLIRIEHPISIFKIKNDNLNEFGASAYELQRQI
jgi:hypothetical protein